MLNGTHFYYKLLRKYTVIFGSFFDQIPFIRYNADGSEEKRIIVPIQYGPKDHYVSRFEADPDLFKSTQITLPRMSFDITGIEYDASRKQNSLLRVARGESATRVSSIYMGVPYDFTYNLYIYTRNVDDGLQIVEQILPYFQPDYTITMNPISALGFLKDVPLILTNVSQEIQHEGNAETVRYCYWTLTFKMKGYFFGPTTTPKIIRESIANIFNDPSLVAGNVIRINTDRGNNGSFQIGDTVYQGNDYETASAYAFVNDWHYENKSLVLGGAQGQFIANSTIRALSTNATYNISSFVADPLKLTKITVQPDPLDALPNSDYGFTTTIQEFPEIDEDNP